MRLPTASVYFFQTSGTCDLQTPMATPLQPILWLSVVVSTDVVRVSEPAMCTLRLSVHVYSLTRWGWENSKPRFWHFEPWFPKVLDITVGSFGSGGEGKVFISASGVVGEGCDPTVIPSLPTAAMLCGDQVLVCTPGRCENRGAPTPVTDWHRSPAASPASPSPTPQNPRHK
jgi:hypothetical protein